MTTGIGLEPSRAAALILLLERIADPARRLPPHRTDPRDAGHDRRIFLQLGAQEFGEGAVGDSEANVYWLELMVDVNPDAARRVGPRRRREQPADRWGVLLVAVPRLVDEEVGR